MSVYHVSVVADATVNTLFRIEIDDNIGEDEIYSAIHDAIQSRNYEIEEEEIDFCEYSNADISDYYELED